MAKTILIVEDDPNIAELVQMYLEKEGYNTRIASDGGQGIDLFRQLRPDLVLLDIMLPVMDGWNVLRTIRLQPRHMLPVKASVSIMTRISSAYPVYRLPLQMDRHRLQVWRASRKLISWQARSVSVD